MKGRALRDARRLRAKVIDAYVNIGREVLPKHFNDTCCVNGTRVALDVLEHFEIAATPIATRVTVVNKIADELLRRHGPHPTAEQVQAWKESGAHMIQIAGTPIDETGYGFHLVCIAGDRLIDSAFGQFNRPGKGIHTPFTLAERCGSDFLQRGVVTIDGFNGAKAVYVAEPDEKGYEQCEGYARSPWNVEIAADIARKIEAVL